METKKNFYVTTAIDYVNARPHVGHAFEKIIADALVRWHILKGEEVWFLTGTDENAQKNAQAAEQLGISTKELVDKNSEIFIELCKKLNVSYNRFIRTTEKEHVKKAQELFKKVYDKGDIYKGIYKGEYCVGCESFKTKRELVDEKCPEHPAANLQLISEEAYFFKLSKYKDKILKFAEDYIVPESRKKEILNRLKNEELKDLNVSRTGLNWGIDSPINKKFKIYVWFDALVNYISGANGNWPADVHIVGKGINWFHSVIWPGMLFSLGEKLPKKLLVHGYLNLKGSKISKSSGNVLDPIKLAEKYGSDSVRYSLLRCSTFEDSDYSEEILIERHNNELADKFGNFVNRVSTLAEKHGLKKTVLSSDSLKISESIDKHIENFELDKAVQEIFAYIDKCNKYTNDKEPWKTKDKKVIYELANLVKDCAILLWPFIPETSEKIAKQFGFKIGLKEIKKPLNEKNKIVKGEILFKKII